MLHIPFSKRDVVSSQRFSIPGVPCLYLGTSSYICWEELNRPSMEKFNISSYKLPGELKVLNLTIDIESIDPVFGPRGDNKYRRLGESLIEMWPLVCATSFKISNATRVFKSEYIISQIVMECARELGIDGVAYYTKRVDLDVKYPWRYVNLALLACQSTGTLDENLNEKDEKNDYAKVCQQIELTTPVNTKEYEFLTNPENCRNQSNNTVAFHLGEKHNIILANTRIQYDKTLFGKIDNYLLNQQHLNIVW